MSDIKVSCLSGARRPVLCTELTGDDNIGFRRVEVGAGRRGVDHGGRGRLHLGSTKYLSGSLALHVQLRRELSASSILARPGRPWRVGRSRPDLRRRLRRLSAPYCDAAHPREPHCTPCQPAVGSALDHFFQEAEPCVLCSSR